jgi:hypothetical protein
MSIRAGDNDLESTMALHLSFKAEYIVIGQVISVNEYVRQVRWDLLSAMGQSGPPRFATKYPYDRKSLKAGMVSRPSGPGADVRRPQ